MMMRSIFPSPPWHLICLCITFNGLSKTYRVAGYRAGWMVLTGPKHHAQGFI